MTPINDTITIVKMKAWLISSMLKLGPSVTLGLFSQFLLPFQGSSKPSTESGPFPNPVVTAECRASLGQAYHFQV